VKIQCTPLAPGTWVKLAESEYARRQREDMVRRGYTITRRQFIVLSSTPRPEDQGGGFWYRLANDAGRFAAGGVSEDTLDLG
jgi:hypothetical protein